MNKKIVASLLAILLTAPFVSAHQTLTPTQIVRARAIEKNHPVRSAIRSAQSRAAVRSAQGRAAVRSQIAGVHSVTFHPVSPASTQFHKIKKQEIKREFNQ